MTTLVQAPGQVLQTTRLVLRPWREQDAEALYELARDPEIGPRAGWPVHTSVENSRQIIRAVLSTPETYAILTRANGGEDDDNRIEGGTSNEGGTGNQISGGTSNEGGTGNEGGEVVGSIGLLIGAQSNLELSGDEAEVGYWVGRQFWGRGYAPEATRELLRRAFDDLGMTTVWCGYFDGNDKSRRVGEKCGFRYRRAETKHWPLIDRTVVQHITAITRDEYKNI